MRTESWLTLRGDLDRKMDTGYDPRMNDDFRVEGSVGGAASGKRDLRTGGDNFVLASAFGVRLLSGEQDLWDALSVDQRRTAIKRLMAILLHERRNPITADEAATEAGLSRNRWYEMYSAWREKRSLASLGVSAAMPRTRTLPYHDALQRLVVGVVDADPKASVRRLALALGAAYGEDTGIAEGGWPAYNTLRKFVEAELRRRSVHDEPGDEVTFDCCACDLPHSGGTFVAFLIIDKASRVVLGGSLGDAAQSRTGYAAAARDALDRIGRDPLDRLAWSGDMRTSEIVLGLDAADWTDFEQQIEAAGLKGQLRPATKARRFGTFVRPLIGQRMGRVKFMPGKTGKVEVLASPTHDDVARFGVEIALYNADLVPTASIKRRCPPSKLIRLLDRVSKG